MNTSKTKMVISSRGKVRRYPDRDLVLKNLTSLMNMWDHDFGY